jgi:hypothetical protein
MQGRHVRERKLAEKRVGRNYVHAGKKQGCAKKKKCCQVDPDISIAESQALGSASLR